VSPSLDELSQEMSPEEKKSLLVKIQASLNLSAKDTDSIVSKAGGPEELKHRLTREVSKLGFLDRLVLQMAAFFRSRTEYEVMADRKLSLPKSVLRDRVPDYVSFHRNEWAPEFGKVFYDFYADALTLRPVFDHLFQQKLTLEAAVIQFIQDEYPEAAQSLEDLLPDEEIGALYRTDQKRSAIVAVLEARLASYLDSIPSSVFEKVRDRLRPLYFLRPLVQFPYPFLLELFGHNPEKAEVTKYPYFLGVSWRKAAGLFERFYYGLYLATKVDYHEGALNILWEGVVDRLGDEKTAWTVDLINQRLGSYIRMAQDTVKRLPWKEILQWSFQDPYYGVKYILPHFSVREFYQNTLVMNFRAQLDDRIPRVRQQLLGEERAILFQNSPSQPLEFYVPGVGASPKTRGFQYPESLSLLWAFLSYHFQKKIIPFYQSLNRMVPPTNKNALQGLTNAVEDLTSLHHRIRQFDASLHPDTEEGKEFQKLKYELNSKALSLKPFLDLVDNKDAQASECLSRGMEGLEILFNQLSGIRDRNIPALKAIMKLPYLLEGQQETIENGLERLLGIVQKTLFVVRESHHLET